MLTWEKLGNLISFYMQDGNRTILFIQLKYVKSLLSIFTIEVNTHQANGDKGTNQIIKCIVLLSNFKSLKDSLSILFK